MIRGRGRQFNLRTVLIVVALIALELSIVIRVARPGIVLDNEASVLDLAAGIANANLPYVLLWGLMRSTLAQHLVTLCAAQRRPTLTSGDDAV